MSGRRWNSWGSSGYAGAGGGGMGIDAIPFDSPIAIVPNNTVNIYWCAPADLTITEIVLFYQTAPASAAGTYLFSCTGAGNNLLAAASFSLETLASGVYTSSLTTPALNLTAVVANLDLVQNAACVFTFVSNNLDLTGAGGYLQVRYVGG